MSNKALGINRGRLREGWLQNKEIAEFSQSGLYRVLVAGGFQLRANAFPFLVELVDFFLVVVHVLRDGGNGVPVAAFGCGHELCLKFSAQGFGFRDIFFEFREFLFERLDDLAAFGDIVGAGLAVFLGAGSAASRIARGRVAAVRFHVDI